MTTKETFAYATFDSLVVTHLLKNTIKAGSKNSFLLMVIMVRFQLDSPRYILIRMQEVEVTGQLWCNSELIFCLDVDDEYPKHCVCGNFLPPISGFCVER